MALGFTGFTGAGNFHGKNRRVFFQVRFQLAVKQVHHLFVAASQ